jgi:3-phosphoshikimate 1-carboxyvinyltransferase
MPEQETSFLVQAGGRLTGELRVASDKSISHRAVLLSGLANGQSRVSQVLMGEDVKATIAAMQALGVAIDVTADDNLVIQGVGLNGLCEPGIDLEMGNSGTAMRLLAGILSAQPFASRLVGDESLSARPMGRIIQPLSSMGAVVECDNQRPPLNIRPATLGALGYDSPVASAQVKSCLLLAGLCAGVSVTVREPRPSRDHTERMLMAMGADLQRQPGQVTIEPGGILNARDVSVPADISSAAFFLVGASLAPGSDLMLTDVCVNPGRTGILDILVAMGANIEQLNPRMVGAEPVADLRVRAAELTGIDIPPDWVPRAIDEFPAVFVAAACARGRTRIRDASELRVKESDRIAVMARALTQLGARIEPHEDGADIDGGSLTGGTVDAADDHRCAMSLAMAGLVCSIPVRVLGAGNVDTSYPEFCAHAMGAGLDLRKVH